MVADELEPAVVNINTESTVRLTHRRFRNGPDDEPFGDLFDRTFRKVAVGGDVNLAHLIVLDKLAADFAEFGAQERLAAGQIKVLNAT